MLDFLPREQTVVLTIGCLIWYIIIYLMLRPAKNYPYTIPNTRYKFAVFFVLLLCLFYFSVGDWFGYYKEFLQATKGIDTHMESVYEWMAKSVSPNYIIWRLIVWGSALFFWVFTMKRLPIPPALCMLVFAAMMITRFAYTRTALALSMMYFGCSLFYVPIQKNKTLSYVLALTAIGCSYFFHKSALFGIAMIILAFIVRKIDWKSILVFVLFSPLLLYLLRNQIADFIMMDFEAGEGGIGEYMYYGQSYMGNQSLRNQGISEIIYHILMRGPVMIIAVVCFLQYNNANIPREIKFFMRLTIFMVIASLICLLNLGANMYVIYYRFLNFAVLPAVLCFSYLYSNRYNLKLLNVIYIMALLGTLYELSYSVYARYLNGALSFEIL